MSTKRAKKSVQYLDMMANHFEFRDWDYTRKSNIKEIRYEKGFDKYNEFKSRLRRSLRWAFGKTPNWITQLEGKWSNGLIKRATMAIYLLKRDKNEPDGILDSGNIITHWEETGEYLSLVQPTVGALLANFLKEEPEHPHAKIITKELDRLYKRLSKRWDDGDVTGTPKQKDE